MSNAVLTRPSEVEAETAWIMFDSVEIDQDPVAELITVLPRAGTDHEAEVIASVIEDVENLLVQSRFLTLTGDVLREDWESPEDDVYDDM